MTEPRAGTCWQCGGRLEGGDYARSESCQKCGSDTRVCRNCQFYAPGRSGECMEPAAEPPKDKTRANFCELFRPGTPKAAEKDPAVDKGKAAFEKLFGKEKPV